MEAGQAAAKGFIQADRDTSVDVRPLADGGEGTVEALVEGMNGIRKTVRVTGPFGTPVECEYGIIEESNTAVIEMAGAAGITLVPREELNPMKATTYGVGEVIAHAIGEGCRRFIIGIGGSATNDCGIGMLQALGFDMLDENGKNVPFGAEGLSEIAEIRSEHALPELKDCTFRIACDVKNPLCGENGCSNVFGPQKGADPEMVRRMDAWMKDFAELVQSRDAQADPEFPGSGAAGGLGFAFRTFLHADLQPGIDIILEETGLEEHIRNADLVVTGEGMLDFQTAMGKAPVGVARLAKKYNKPVIAFAGGVTKEAAACNENGIDAFFPIVRGVSTLDEAMKFENARENLAETAEQVLRLYRMAI